MQLPQLLLTHRSGRVDHQVDGFGGLGEGDYLAEARRTSQDHHDAVEAERDAAVRWGAVFEGIEEEPEPLLRLRIRHAQRPEDLGLHILAMNTNRTPTKLRPLNHNSF